MSGTPTLTPEQINEVAHELQGTCDSGTDTLEKVLGPEWEGVDVQDLGDSPLWNMVERCNGCEWWHETGELTDTGSRFLCPDCLKDARQAGEDDVASLPSDDDEEDDE